MTITIRTVYYVTCTAEWNAAHGFDAIAPAGMLFEVNGDTISYTYVW